MPWFIEAKLFILIFCTLPYKYYVVKCSIIGDWKEARGSSFYLSIIYLTKQSDKQYQDVQNDALNNLQHLRFRKGSFE